ncbi:MAG: hypothetical protein RE472_02745 [Thermoplasmatales archaeon]|nr:MAG: hypothetical protein RE472_02745 [Thermoplasmatales archaeon]
MANDIPSEIQALVLGAIFIFIGYSFLSTYISAGVGTTFAQNVGWAFIAGGVISFLAGIVSLIQRFR